MVERIDIKLLEKNKEYQMGRNSREVMRIHKIIEFQKRKRGA